MKIAIFNYLDFGYVGSWETHSFKIIDDLLVPQSSTFIVDNSDGIENKMVVVAPLNNGGVYLGIVTSVRVNDEDETSTVTTNNISSILDVPIALEQFTSAVYGAKVKEFFDNAFISTTDILEKLSWFTCVNNATESGASPAWSANSTESLLQLISEFMDISNIGFKFSLASGNKGVVLTLFDRPTKEATIKLSEEFISNMTYSGTNQVSVNKIIMKPQADNYLHKDIITYYLLNDGTVTTNSGDNKRISPVVSKILFYTDTQFIDSSLLATAKSNLAASMYSHEVSFRIRTKEMSMPTLKKMIALAYCGMRIVLYGVPGMSESPMNSVISKLTFTENDYMDVVCGFSRSSLTDRMKIGRRDNGKTTSTTYKIANGTLTQSVSKEFSGSEGQDYDFTVSITLPKGTFPAGAELWEWYDQDMDYTAKQISTKYENGLYTVTGQIHVQVNLSSGSWTVAGGCTLKAHYCYITT